MPHYEAQVGAMMITPVRGSTARDDALHAMRARLHGFIARRVESPDVADDLTQEVLLRLLAHNDGRVANPTAWLYRVARNVIIDHYRTRASHSRGRHDDGDLAAAVPAEDPFDDDPQAAHRELAGCLGSLVDQLAEPYRSAVTAVDLHGRTHTDVAHVVGLSVSGMKSRVQRGRRQVRQLLTECCRVYTTRSGSISGYEPVTGCERPSGGGSLRCSSVPDADQPRATSPLRADRS
jgi:RNA polymerase sigma-70 factor (ECF subfamily)